ncbi:MAG: division/cell wall cluster transcriptional repressor MraZ [Acutalibacteraceae bacterium]
MLTGTYEHNVDSKGRVFMPIKLRSDLGDNFVVTKGLDGCLFVYSMSEWTRLDQEIRALPFSQSRNIQRFLFASAVEVEPDSQGRICIPKILRDYAKLEKNATIIGASTRVEIWSKDLWNNECNEITPEAIAEIMEKLNF